MDLFVTDRLRSLLLLISNEETGLQIEGVLAYFMHLKCKKTTLGIRNTYKKKNLLCKNMTPNALKCILLPYKYLKFV
jgi:hypothetical protein